MIRCEYTHLTVQEPRKSLRRKKYITLHASVRSGQFYQSETKVLYAAMVMALECAAHVFLRNFFSVFLHVRHRLHEQSQLFCFPFFTMPLLNRQCDTCMHAQWPVYSQQRSRAPVLPRARESRPQNGCATGLVFERSGLTIRVQDTVCPVRGL